MYASLEDVKRILRIPADSVDEERDNQLRGALDAVNSWAEGALTISKDGPGLEVYFDIPEDSTLKLPAADVTVTTVKVFEYPSAFGIPLSPIELGLGHGYDLTTSGLLILRPTLFVSPFEGATAQRRLRTYCRVEVNYIGTGVVPRRVTEGIAFLAAGYWQDGPRALTGLTSEKIGDYSYTLGGANDGNDMEPSFVQRAKFFLGNDFRRQRVFVT